MTTPADSDDRHRHLPHLADVWINNPVYFLTVCVADRRPVLTDPVMHAILVDEWRVWNSRHGWQVGRYVIMPDHVHFFACPLRTTRKRISQVVGAWKEWTAKRWFSVVEAGDIVAGGADPGLTVVRPETSTAGVNAPGYNQSRRRLWQPEFFDHVLRSHENYATKWSYVSQNPVRAGLAISPEAWPYAGHIDFDVPL